jgi:hypothetical protein
MPFLRRSLPLDHAWEPERVGVSNIPAVLCCGLHCRSSLARRLRLRPETFRRGRKQAPGTIRGRVTRPTRGCRCTVPSCRSPVYFVVAVPRRRVLLNPDTSPEILEALVKEATTVVVGEDDKRTLDLRVAPGPQDR